MEQDLDHALELLKANKLSELNLNDKNLTEAQVIRLEEVLKHNQSLTTLNLSANQLGVAGAEKLSEALKVNQTLTTLNLGYNQFDNATLQGIQEALQTNINQIKSARNQTLLTLVCAFASVHASYGALGNHYATARFSIRQARLSN